MPRQRLNLVGKRFGRLVVIELAGSHKKQGTRWRCRCECGVETVVFRSHLTRGHTQSCGCLRKEADGRPEHRDVKPEKPKPTPTPAPPVDPVTEF